MSAWSHRIFDDDVTLDALCELDESESLLEELENFLDQALESDEGYLDYENGAYSLAAAAVIDAKINGVEMDILSDGCADKELNSILKKLEDCDVSGLREMALNVVKAVASDNSELRELWEESEECYPMVMAIYKKLIERLSKC